MSNRRQFAKTVGLSGVLLAAAERGSAAAEADTAAPNVTQTARALAAAIESDPVDDTHCHPMTENDAQTMPEHFLERMALPAMPEASYFPLGVWQRWREGKQDTREKLDRQHGIGKTIKGIIKHYRETIFIKSLTKEMVRFPGCKPDLQSVIAARNERGKNYDIYIRYLFVNARLGNVTIDTVFAEGTDAKRIRRFERAIALSPGVCRVCDRRNSCARGSNRSSTHDPFSKQSNAL